MNSRSLLAAVLTLATTQVAASGFAASYNPVGVCILIASKPSQDDKISSNHLSVRAFAANLVSFHADEQFSFDYEHAIVSLLKAPDHGTLSSGWAKGLDAFYFPNLGYVGKDSATFLVNIEGNPIKVIYKLIVGVEPSIESYKEFCPDPNWWEIR